MGCNVVAEESALLRQTYMLTPWRLSVSGAQADPLSLRALSPSHYQAM